MSNQKTLFTEILAGFRRQIARFEKMKKTRRVIRVVRVASISLGIYSAGHHSGMVEFAKDPVKVEKQLAMQLIKAQGATRVLKKSHPDHQRAERVSRRVLTGALDFTNINIEEQEHRILTLQKVAYL